MTKRTRILTGIAVAIGVLVIGGIAMALQPKTTPTETVTVARGTVAKTVDISGHLERTTDLDLAFQAGGIVSGIPVRVGSKVYAGDILAFLAADDLSANAAASAATVAEAQANFAARTAGATVETQAQSEAAVAQAKVALANAEQSVVDTENVGNVAVARAQEDVTQTTDSSAAARITARINALDAADGGLAAIRAAITRADSVLGIENGFINDPFEDYLASLDPNTLNQATIAFYAAKEKRDAAEAAMLAVRGDDTLAMPTEQISSALRQSNALLLSVAQVLAATSIDTAEFTAIELDALKNTIASERSSVAAAQGSFNSAASAYTDALRAADDAETNAAQALTAAEANRDANNAAAKATVANAVATLVARTADLTATNAGIPDAEANALRAAVTRAQANYSAALVALTHAQITAPIDGIVTDIFIDEGEYVTPGTRGIRVESADNVFTLTLDVPESDIASLAVGQTAAVTVDAIGETVFAGSVVSVAPTQKDIEGAVFYEAEVLLADATSATLRTGMSADAVVNIATKENVLFVAQRAVLRKDGVDYVRIPAGNESGFEERAVTVGLRGDDGFVEIVSGVNEGEQVVIRLAK